MTTKLVHEVAQWAKEYYTDDVIGALNELQRHGCQSGMVSGLIYYDDTVKFYQAHQAEINATLSDVLESLGLDGPRQLFGDKWDDTDPLALEQQNQNLLAWFAFEETAYNLLARVENN